MSRLISRNPFTRSEFTSRTEHFRPSVTCDWCGSPGRSLRSGLVSLKVFSFEPDSISTRRHDMSGAFCSVDCCRQAHDLGSEVRTCPQLTT